MQIDGGGEYEVTLRQNYQNLVGAASAEGKLLRMSAGGLRGDEIGFTLNDGSVRQRFRGTVTGEGMQGTVDLGGGRTSRWTAKKG
jgi:hypothetical protein